MEKKTIGSFLTALRKASGMTQRQLAEKLNVSDKAISRWERDECAPDLSLIPVLAEIYGVTSDEILRGQRNNPDAPREVSPEKAEKQRKRLLASALTKFRTSSLLSAVVAIIGLIAACALNFELAEANLGFLMGSVFFIIAAACQMLFTVHGLLAVKDDDWNSREQQSCIQSMILWTEWIISAVILLFVGLLPLAGASHQAVPLLTCLNHGVRNILFAAIACFLLCLALNLYLFRGHMPKLRQCVSCLLSIFLIFSLVGHTILNRYMTEHPYLYAEHTQFKTLAEFRDYMETPDSHIIDEEYPSDFPPNHTTVVYDSLTEGKPPKIYPDGAVVFPAPNFFTAEYGYAFKHLNKEVVWYSANDSEDLLPVRTMTAEQMGRAQHTIAEYSIQYGLIYLLIILLGSMIYLPLRKQYV